MKYKNAFADKINVTQKLESALERVEIITAKSLRQKLESALERVEIITAKGENAGNQHFLLFPQCFLTYKRQVVVTLNLSFANA